MTPQMAGRIGGLTTSSRHDPKEYTRAAREGFMARLRREVTEEAEGPVSEAEFERRVEAKHLLHYARMSEARWGKRRKGKGD